MIPPTEHDPSNATLPNGSTVQQIAYVTEPAAGQQVLLDFPHPIRRRAVIVSSELVSPTTTADGLLVLSIPAIIQDGPNESENELSVSMRAWVDTASNINSPPSLWMTFQGAQVCWNHGRLAILAHPDRLAAVQKALVEVLYYETELREIERTLGETWPQLEADTPLAFEFDAASIGKRKELRQRFQQFLMLRAKLARIGPFVHCPFLHPPTLSSQIGERFRERTRMMHRHEFLREQVEVYERVYEMCGQRSSDFMLARSGHMLEWIIIVLLLVQSLFYGFELLTSMGK